MNDFDNISEESIKSWLESNIGYELFKPGLDRLKPQFAAFKKIFRQRGLKIITIGGTNGKGETAHCLSEMMHKAGPNVALWTSPHILSIKERFCFNQQLISYSELSQLFISCFNDKRASSLSYYEFLLFSFCQRVVEREEIEVIIFEVGLGGRLDAVNLFNPDLTAISSISRDHEDILGRGEKNIVYEKLGITRFGIPLITSLESPEIRDIVALHCKKESVPYFDLHENKIVSGGTLYWQQNRILASILFDRFWHREVDKNINYIERIASIAFSSLKGRFEVMTLGCRRFIFVGAHNIDGMEKMTQALLSLEGAQNTSFDRAIVAFSDRPLADVQEGLKILLSVGHLFCQLVVTTFDHPRSLHWTSTQRALSSAMDLYSDSKLEKRKVSFVRDWKDIIFDKPQKNETILVTGSYYFFGELQKYLLAQKNISSTHSVFNSATD